MPIPSGQGMSGLFSHLSVADNIAFGLHRQSRSQRRQRTDELLALTGLDSHARHYPHQLACFAAITMFLLFGKIITRSASISLTAFTISSVEGFIV